MHTGHHYSGGDEYICYGPPVETEGEWATNRCYVHRICGVCPASVAARGGVPATAVETAGALAYCRAASCSVILTALCACEMRRDP